MSTNGAEPCYLTELRGPADWQNRLGDPDKHWKRGASAMELAVQWLAARESGDGVPTAVRRLLDSHPITRGLRLSLAIPERRTPLPGGATASQSDLFALLENESRRVSMIVEGKAKEPFDKRVADWAKVDKPSPRKSGKPERLDSLCKHLGLDKAAVQHIRYQLLHRTVAAILEAKLWRAEAGVMLVERFAISPGTPADSFQDFADFARLFGIQALPGTLYELQLPSSGQSAAKVLIGWLDLPVASDAEILATLVPRVSDSDRRV